MVTATRARDYAGMITNTAYWDRLELRPDDIIVSTPPKSGTTWTLSIINMLLAREVTTDAGSASASPWMDCGLRDCDALVERASSIQRRRAIKSHTPLDGVPFSNELTYIVVYRHPIDVHFSMRSHAENMRRDTLDFMFPADERAGFQRFIANPLTDTGTDDLTLASLVHHYNMSKAYARTGNVHFIHYADLSRDLPATILRLAKLLQVDLGTEVFAAITQANTFAAMRRQAEESADRFDENSAFLDNAKFFASGTSNKWEGRLCDEDLEAYRARIADLLPTEDIAWLHWGARRA